MMIQQALFWGFSTLLVLAATMTVFSRQAVRSALWLVLAFFTAASLWIMLQAEFLGLVLVLVYVGAVMTLFLFVIMTLPNTRIISPTRNTGIKQYLLAMSVVILWLALVLYALFSKADVISLHQTANNPAVAVSNTQLLGQLLYTTYVYPFELVGVLLLVAIVAAISLSSGQSSDYKSTPKQQQIQVKREDRVKLIKIKAIRPFSKPEFCSNSKHLTDENSKEVY